MLQTIHKYQKRTAIVAEQFIVSASNFTASILLARYLGLELFAVFASIQIVQLFFGGFHQALVIAPMASVYSGLKESKSAYLASLSMLHFLYLLAILLITVTVYLFSFNSFAFPLLASFCFISVLLSYNFIRRLLFVSDKNNFLLLLNTVAYLLPLALIYFFRAQLSLVLVLWVYSACIMFAILLSTLNKYVRIQFSKANKSMLKEIWSFSKWLFAKSAVQWFAGNYFIVIAGAVLGSSAIGIIRIIQNIFGVFNVFITIAENYLAVKSAQILAAQNAIYLKKYQLKLLFKLGVFIGSLLLVACYFATDLLVLLYGLQYAKYAYLIYGFAVLYLFIVINLSPNFMLRAAKYTKPIFLSYAISALFGLFFAKILVQEFSLFGAVIGLIVSQLIILVYNSIAVKNKLLATV